MFNAPKKGGLGGGFLTIKSLLFSLLGIFIISGLTGYHDSVLMGTFMVGNHLPAGGVAYIALVGLLWNGLWQLFSYLGKSERLERFILSTKEMTLVFVATFVSCYAPSSGLFRYFHRMIMLPWKFFLNKEAWRESGVLTEFLNPNLFPSPVPIDDSVITTKAYETVYNGFFTGLRMGNETVPLWDLPLGAWWGVVSLWGPLLLTLALAVIAMQFLVHRQWAYHEQLSFPLAQVMNTFCVVDEKKKGIPLIFRNRLFWWGMIPLFLLLMLQYISMWYPQSFPSLSEVLPNMRQWWLPITNNVPILKKTPAGWTLDSQTLYFTIVGVAYFVSSEVSLTLGLAPVLLGIFGIAYFGATGVALDGTWVENSRVGAAVGFTIILLYTGRAYYGAVLRRAFGFKKSGDDSIGIGTKDDVSVLAARILMLATIGFVVMLTIMGSSLIMSIFYALSVLIMYLVLSRLVCETGIPFVQGWPPASFLLRAFGPAAMGPKSLTFLLWGTGIIAQDARECLMPYVATGVKVADDNGIKLKKLFGFIVVAVVLSIAIAYLCSTYALYNYGPMTDAWAAKQLPQLYLDQAARSIGNMKATGVFEASVASGQFARLSLISSTPKVWSFFFMGLFSVVVLYMLRFRFTKFPIHPLLFVIWGLYPSNMTWGSFLIGWFIKILVVKFGGGSVYQKLKPFFVGIISAELLVVGICLIVDFLHFLIFGTAATVKFVVLPM